ncbi:DUF1579 domain-containing protein [candidate division KSB1 bacterium]|nr:DUF1579 domain-containing protein [candidate division KSB1 bacterium]
MNIRKMFCTIVLICLTVTITSARSQEKKAGTDTKAAAMPNMEEMMKKWMDAITPNENHKRLDMFVGSWETTTSMWMEGPGKSPIVTKGTAEFKWILGGRYIQQDINGEMMGQRLTGVGFTGYDNFNKKFVSFWIDNMSTAMYPSEGSFDQSGKVLTTYGKIDEPMTGEHDINVKYVSRIISPDKFIFEVHNLAIGEPNTRVVEVTYTRKKP